MQIDRIKKLFGQDTKPVETPQVAASADPAPSAQASPSSAAGSLYDRVIDALRTVHDPEIPVNIYDLGLIYECLADEATGAVKIKMTLTTPNCPVAGEMPNTTRRAVEKVPGVTHADVELTWEPRWTQDMMSEDAKLALS